MNIEYIHALQRRELRYLKRLVILNHYSNPQGHPICNHCGEQNLDCLCIDHILGGGRKQLRETKSKGSSFYHWLINNGLPDGYQILCANCNLIKSKYEQVNNKSL